MGTCTVELQSLDGASAAAVQQCDRSGFEFPNVPRGEYNVIVHRGVAETSEEVAAEGMVTYISVNAPQAPAQESSQATISLNELKVPDKAKDLVNKANEDLQHFKIADAEKDTQSALKIAPGFALGHAMEAAIALEQNNLPKAIQSADLAVKLDPQVAYAQFVRAGILNRLKRYSDAKMAAEQGLRVEANSWQGHFELAQALSGIRNEKDALNEATLAEEAAPKEFAPVHILRIRLLIKRHELSAAKQELKLIGKDKEYTAQAARLQQMLAVAEVPPKATALP